MQNNKQNSNLNNQFDIPIITVDGGAATGKGAVAGALAQKLRFNYLDSGVFYRALAYLTISQNVNSEDLPQLILLANQLSLEFSAQKILLIQNNSKIDITNEIRSEVCSAMSSKISHWQEVRQALLANQRRAKKTPGLVAEGRDMGTVVFPEAQLKFFLECDAKIRAQRRQKQLENQGVYANINEILYGINVRDERDQNRAVSPLKPAESAIVINTTTISLIEVIQLCVDKSLAVFAKTL